MARQSINIGAAPNDGTGDSIRVAMSKANANFVELYANDAAAPTGVVTTVQGRTGAVTLTTADITALGFSTGSTGGTTTSSGVTTFNSRSGTISLTSQDVTTALGYNPYNSGNPAGYITAAGAPVQTVSGRVGAVVLTISDVSGAAPLASPVFSGIPIAPTAAVGTNTQQIATVAFANAAAAAAASGSSSIVAKTITTGASYTMAQNERRIWVNKTTGSATTILLPSSPLPGVDYIVKDAKGDASVNNITLQTQPISGAVQTIDGSSTIVLGNARESITVIYNGSEWSLC